MHLAPPLQISCQDMCVQLADPCSGTELFHCSGTSLTLPASPRLPSRASGDPANEGRMMALSPAKSLGRRIPFDFTPGKPFTRAIHGPRRTFPTGICVLTHLTGQRMSAVQSQRVTMITQCA